MYGMFFPMFMCGFWLSQPGTGTRHSYKEKENGFGPCSWRHAETVPEEKSLQEDTAEGTWNRG